MTFDALDLSREREDDFLAGTADDFRARALERADRLREVSDVADMGWPPISIERVRPARREPRFTGAELGFLLCAVLLTLGWLVFLALCAWLVLG